MYIYTHMCVYDYIILYHIISYYIILYYIILYYIIYIILLYYIFTCIHIVQMLSNLHPKDWQMSSYRNRFPQISMTDHLFPHSNGLNLSYYVFFSFSDDGHLSKMPSPGSPRGCFPGGFADVFRHGVGTHPYQIYGTLPFSAGEWKY